MLCCSTRQRSQESPGTKIICVLLSIAYSTNRTPSCQACSITTSICWTALPLLHEQMMSCSTLATGPNMLQTGQTIAFNMLNYASRVLSHNNPGAVQHKLPSVLQYSCTPTAQLRATSAATSLQNPTPQQNSGARVWRSALTDHTPKHHTKKHMSGG
jgi:hypothetical protein